MTALRVLMVGPALDAPGGVAVVARRLLDAAPPNVNLIYLATTVDGTRSQRFAASLKAMARAPGVVHGFKPHVAHVHVAGARSLPRKAAFVAELRAQGVPVVTHCHFAGDAPTGGSRVQRAFLRSIVSMSTRVVALSATQEAHLQPLVGGRLARVVNGVPTERFVPLGPAGGEPTLLYLGGRERRKGWEDLATALEGLGDRTWRLRLGGQGSEDIAHAFDPDRIEVLGRLDEDATLEALQDADVFVLPSRAEGLPLALLEAMSCGAACIASGTDGMLEAVEDGRTGLLVPPQDPDALARALRRLIDDANLRNSLGRAARVAAVERFSLSSMVASLEAIWCEVAGHPSASA
jgi:glycosyltransferase involved in cell wall biosynthesis